MKRLGHVLNPYPKKIRAQKALNPNDLPLYKYNLERGVFFGDEAFTWGDLDSLCNPKIYEEVKQLAKESPWWGALPEESTWLLDTNIWMQDALGMDIWFSKLPKMARQKKSKVLFFGPIIEELSQLTRSDDKAKAYLARMALKRMENLQKEDTEAPFISSQGIRVKDSPTYADPPIIAKCLKDSSCILLTNDRAQIVRLQARANQDHKKVRVLSWSDFEVVPCIDFPEMSEFERNKYLRKKKWEEEMKEKEEMEKSRRKWLYIKVGLILIAAAIALTIILMYPVAVLVIIAVGLIVLSFCDKWFW